MKAQLVQHHHGALRPGRSVGHLADVHHPGMPVRPGRLDRHRAGGQHHRVRPLRPQELRVHRVAGLQAHAGPARLGGQIAGEDTEPGPAGHPGRHRGLPAGAVGALEQGHPVAAFRGGHRGLQAARAAADHVHAASRAGLAAGAGGGRSAGGGCAVWAGVAVRSGGGAAPAAARIRARPGGWRCIPASGCGPPGPRIPGCRTGRCGSRRRARPGPWPRSPGRRSAPGPRRPGHTARRPAPARPAAGW